MSEPAYFFVGLDEIYFDRYEAQHLDQWLLWGPEVLVPYLRILGPPLQEKSQPRDVAFGGFALFPEKKRLLWFGSETMQCPFLCRLYLKLQRALWPSAWTIDWAGRGLDSLLDATARPRQTFREPDRNNRYVIQAFDMLGRESAEEFEVVGAASVRHENGGLELFSLHDGDVTETYLWAGPGRVLEALGRRRGAPSISFPTGERPVGCNGGFHIDLATRTISHWSHQPVCDAVPPEAWPGWRIQDWEERYESHLQVTDGRLSVVYPPAERLLSEMKAFLVAKEPLRHDPFRRLHSVYDGEGELVEMISFPVDLGKREALWERALRETGFAQQPLPKQW